MVMRFLDTVSLSSFEHRRMKSLEYVGPDLFNLPGRARLDGAVIFNSLCLLHAAFVDLETDLDLSL